MLRVIVSILIMSLVFTGTANATGIDVGAPNCHNINLVNAEYQSDPGGHLLQKEAVCDCDCSCCNYVAHLIPIPCLSALGVQAAPATMGLTMRQFDYSSFRYPPPTPPPNT